MYGDNKINQDKKSVISSFSVLFRNMANIKRQWYKYYTVQKLNLQLHVNEKNARGDFIVNMTANVDMINSIFKVLKTFWKSSTK